MVLSHRPGTIPEDAPVHPEADLGETRIELTGLDREGTRQLVEQVVGRRSVPDAFVDAVQDRTGGTPLFVETTVETLLETGQVDPQIGVYPSGPGEFDLPEEVTETIQQQATALEADVRDILEWVAVASGYVPVSLVEAAAGDRPKRVGTVLDTVTGMGLLERETRDGERWVTFRNELFGDALADRLADSDRKHRHETIARLLEDRLGERDDPDHQAAADRAATVAYHCEQSGDLTSGVEWYETAANRATDVYAHETAITYYYRLIDLARQADDTETLLTANEELAEIYLVTGDLGEAEKHVQFVRERVESDDSTRNQRLARLQGRVHNARSEFETAIEVATSALNGEATVEQCRLLDVVAMAHEGLSDYEQMRETAQRQRETADAIDEPGLEADAIKQLGTVSFREGSYDQAHEYYTASLAIAEKTGDDRRKDNSLHNLGLVADFQSRYDEAREHFETSLTTAREIEHHKTTTASLIGLGDLARRRGDDDSAREYYEEALELVPDHGLTANEAKGHGGLCALTRRDGDYDRAGSHFEQALALTETDGNPFWRGQIRLEGANLALARGDITTARQRAERARETFEEVGTPFDALETLEALVDCCRAQGDGEAVERWTQRAQQILADAPDEVVNEYGQWVEHHTGSDGDTEVS